MKNKIIKTRHRDIRTPFFMPDATRALVKGLSASEVVETSVRAMVVNTFHLYLEPGLKVIKRVGGIHEFMDFPGVLLSDSGGFQVFSLIHQNPRMGRITDEGAFFKSPIDGSSHLFTPEKSIQIQFELGTDMMVVLDDCPPYSYSKKKVKEAVQRTIDWARRSKEEYDRQVKKRGLNPAKKPLLFAVIQGSLLKDLRRECAEGLLAIGFDGYGFGGRPVDNNGRFLNDLLQYVANLIPDDKLKFALGVGTPDDIKKCHKMGWDMFDCVIPTREGRHGKLFVKKSSKLSSINISNSRFSSDISKINPGSKLNVLREYSKAYLHHLFKINDPLGARLATLNNLEVYSLLMRDLS